LQPDPPALYLASPFPSTYPAPTALYTLSLHDALPIFAARAAVGLRVPHALPARDRRVCAGVAAARSGRCRARGGVHPLARDRMKDRKSTRLNSSHLVISYAVFCLKKKKNK